MFSTLGPQGLTAPRQLAVSGGFGVETCHVAQEWAIQLWSLSSGQVAFYGAGRWSTPVYTALDLFGAGGRDSGLYCRSGLALLMYAVMLSEIFHVQESRCTHERCVTRSSQWATDRDDREVLAASLIGSDGMERTLAIRKRSRMARWPELGHAAERVLLRSKRLHSWKGFVRREVALLLYSDGGHHLLRIDGDGHVSSCSVPLASWGTAAGTTRVTTRAPTSA